MTSNFTRWRTRRFSNQLVVELYLNTKLVFDYCQPPKRIYGTDAESKKIYLSQYTFKEFAHSDETFRNFFQSVRPKSTSLFDTAKQR